LENIVLSYANISRSVTRSTPVPRRLPSAMPRTSTGTPSMPLEGSRVGVVQRKCACGGGCPDCRQHASPPPGLKISQPSDALEQEADQIAEQVMRMSVHELSISTATTQLSRKCAACEDEDARAPWTNQAETAAVSEVHGLIHDVLRSPGHPLDAGTRAFFEPRFGRDFGQVRVHADGEAAKGARAVQARAYTVGRDIAFAAGQYSPETSEGKRLLAHELTHVVQQGGAGPQPVQSEGSEPATTFQRTVEQASSKVSGMIQRAGDPAAIPTGFTCPTDLTLGRPAGTDVLFPLGDFTITAAHRVQLTAFRDAWLAAGGTEDILVHGYASTDGDQASNWTLSCNRAMAVQTALEGLGIPAIHIDVVAHGESTDFGAGPGPNRHAVVSTSAAGFFSNPLVFGLFTPVDNFAGRSFIRFGVGEVVNLDFFSFPPRPAADFGGLEWHLAAGGGTLTAVTNVGTATYTAPAIADTVTLELRVATGATAGRVMSSHAITIVIPNGVRMVAVPGTAPGFANPGVVPAGTWGAGFRANPFIDPRDVSFRGVMFGEGTVVSVVTPAGSFLSPFAGLAHPVGGLVPGGGGNATTGTPALGVDNITTGQLASTGTLFGLPTCGTSDFLWAIPWEFSVGGGPRTPFATANHHATSTFFCDATIEKAGAGPFCRRIDGTTC
jgi:outer membrane protein OmpA-like peptidoglycan-associated protein